MHDDEGNHDDHAIYTSIQLVQTKLKKRIIINYIVI